MPVFDTTTVIGGFGQIIQNDWALGDDRQFSGDTQMSPNPPPPNDLSLTDAYFTLKSSPTQPDSDSLIQKHITQTPSSDGFISIASGGFFTSLLIKISSGDYEGLTNVVAGPAYNWDIRCITAGGVTFTIATGIVVFLQNDTQTNQSGIPAVFPNNGVPRFRGFVFNNPQFIQGFPGFFNAGDFYYNVNPINGNGSGWQCTIAGSPGTWIPFGGGGGGGHTQLLVIPQSASPFTSSFNQFIAASASATLPTIINLPPALGTGNTVIVKKMDVNAPAVSVASHTTDTIDGSTMPFNITIQFESITFLDFASGQWAII